jgi:hypothetical protein
LVSTAAQTPRIQCHLPSLASCGFPRMPELTVCRTCRLLRSTLCSCILLCRAKSLPERKTKLFLPLPHTTHHRTCHLLAPALQWTPPGCPLSQFISDRPALRQWHIPQVKGSVIPAVPHYRCQSQAPGCDLCFCHGRCIRVTLPTSSTG